MTTSYKNITEKAVRSIGSVSAVARKFNFKSSQSVANWIIRIRRETLEAIDALAQMVGVKVKLVSTCSNVA